MYESFKPEDRPKLVKTSKLVGAGGVNIKELGKGKFTLQLGPVSMQTEAIVAEIDDDGLLGVDVLQNGEGRPTDLLMSEGVLKVDGKEVPIIQVGMKNRIRKVTSADHFVIPAQSEAVIDVYIERQEYDDFSAETDYIIEPTDHFKETYPLQMAPTLCDINQECTSKVRLLNPFPTAVSIKQDAVVGWAEPIDGTPKALVQEEDANEADNFHQVRRLTFARQDNIKNRCPSSQAIKRSFIDTEAQVPDHLTDMYTRASTDLNPQEKVQLASLLNRFGDSFSCGEWDLGLTNLAEHAIETEDAAPIKQHPRRVPLAHAEAEKQAIEDLKAKGVIRESTSPWASPIVLVAKKDGGVRPCVDYRRVNQLVKPDGFPLPRIQDCLDAVAGSSLFSTMDLTSGYFQIPVKREDIPKTAFVCKYGHFEMTRMPFGLNNAASTFQRTMELALQGLQWVTCLIYIDDVIVFGKDFDEHMQRLEEVLDRIKKAGLKLKASKSYLLQKEVIFLGHVVSGEGIKPSPTNVTKVVDWPTPKTAKQVKQFVAMASYYRRYVRNFASTARPMVDLTKKGKKFLWSEACENAFNSLKRALISADVMGYPLNEAGEFILDVDASDLGIGAVLHQVQGGKETVLAYASRSLNKAEANYCITEKELLAARYFIEYFRQYLLGRRFLVRSDHQSLVWLFQLKEPRGKIARWIEILSQYDFAIQYRPGKKQPHCDALSRCENPRACDCPQQDTMEPLKCGPCRKCVKRAQDMVHEKLYKDLTTHESALQQDTQTAKGVDELPEAVPGPSSKPDSSDCTQPDPHLITSWFQGKSTAELRKLQENDSDIGPILRAFASERRPTNQEMSVMSPASRHYWIIWDTLILQDSLLCKKFIKKDGTGEYIQFIVPTAMKKEVLHQMHNSVLSGHLGCKKTKAKIIQRFYWYSLRDDIKLHIQKCDVCAADKKPTKVLKAPLGQFNAGAPGDCVATDYLGPLPVTGRGNRYILLLTDHFTKYVEIIPVPDMTAEICAQKILNEFISRWGCPLSVHSDQGRTYESQVFKQLCRMLEIRKTRTSPRHPQGNGQSERFNRTLLRMVKAYLCGEQRDWDLHLGCLAGAYRATPNESTKLSPNLLTIGREVRLPAELVFSSKSTCDGLDITSYGEYVDQLRQKMQYAHEVARKHLSCSAKRSKEIYDTKISVNQYQVGDVVWLLQEARHVGECQKLVRIYEGPYLVIRKYSDINFLLQLDGRGKTKPAHHNKLKPYEGDKAPRWVLKSKRQISSRRGNRD